MAEKDELFAKIAGLAIVTTSASALRYAVQPSGNRPSTTNIFTTLVHGGGSWAKAQQLKIYRATLEKNLKMGLTPQDFASKLDNILNGRNNACHPSFEELTYNVRIAEQILEVAPDLKKQYPWECVIIENFKHLDVSFRMVHRDKDCHAATLRIFGRISGNK